MINWRGVWFFSVLDLACYTGLIRWAQLSLSKIFNLIIKRVCEKMTSGAKKLNKCNFDLYSFMYYPVFQSEVKIVWHLIKSDVWKLRESSKRTNWNWTFSSETFWSSKKAGFEMTVKVFWFLRQKLALRNFRVLYKFDYLIMILSFVLKF